MAFAYGGDVGTPSYTEVENFCRGLGVSFTVSSDLRSDGSNSYHNTGNAADLTSSAGQMSQLAKILWSNYYPYMLELIHSGGSGYFVKDGKQVSASFYGADTVSQHYDHVHVAMTVSGVTAARAAGGRGTGASVSNADYVDTMKTGCLPLILVSGGIMIIGELLWKSLT